ncbi:MAG TPA: carboxypeptidase regulatory-like domain-containing protein [Streptosporangiales bacterium]
MGTRSIPRLWAAVAAAAFVVLVAALAQGAAAGPVSADSRNDAAHYTPAGCNEKGRATGRLTAHCLATVWTPNTTHRIAPDAAGPPQAARTPADIRDAYHLPDAGQGQTVAIVDALGDSSAEDDLAVFRAQFGLPPCTSADGCFRKVDQRGGTDYPADDSGWALETALDLDAVSAACPRCNILLVQADTANIDDLAVAEQTAVSLGAVAVSNSWGIDGEDPGQVDYDHFFEHKGVAITFSSGDVGNQIIWPSSNPNVTAVGGTSLTKDTATARGWTERAWGTDQSGVDGAGSGCSSVEARPDYQNDYTTDCTRRATADVSAVADPATGLAVYDTLGQGGWLQVGGTSLASPLVASMYALAGAPGSGDYPVSYAYHDPTQSTDVFDVTDGVNGTCGGLLCQAGPGWDGPTGLGTPNGVKALTGGPHGTVTGTVTASDTGKPVPDVTVSTGAGHYSTTTDAAGHYTLDGVLAGDYHLTATSAFGYQAASADVTVTGDRTTTQDFMLTPTPTQTVSGKVTAAQGRPWPLYAKVTADDGAGHEQVAFTDPVTGAYTLHLLQHTDYTLKVGAVYSGYRTAEEKVAVGDGDVTEDVGLDVDTVACTAIGYGSTDVGLHESFDRSGPPRGWGVGYVDRHYPGYSARPGWVFTDAGSRGNGTGGTGGFAVVDSDHTGPHHYQDTTLTSPAVDMRKDTGPVLQFATDLKPAVNSTAAADLSVDGGRHWSTVWSARAFPGKPGPATVAVEVPQAAGKAQVRVRFHYTGSWSQYWQLDDVFLGNRTCAPVDGGLVVGEVNDTGGAGVVGATVSNAAHPEQTATTVPTPDDQALGDGFYWLFSPATGQQTFDAAKKGYDSASASTTVATGAVSRLDFTLHPTG